MPELNSMIKFAPLATRSADGSIIRLTLNGSHAEDDFLFEEEVLGKSLLNMIQKTEMEDTLNGP